MSLTLPGYSVTELIHEGARSRVYRGARLADGKPVIIKVHRSEHPSFLELGQYRNQYTITRDLDVPGVAGIWSYRDGHHRHRRFDACDGLSLSVCYLDDDPVAAAGPIGEVLAERWAATDIRPQLAAPFEVVTPFSWEQRRRVGTGA